MIRIAISVASIALLAGATTADAAQSRYLCDEPPTSRDARACEAAQEGPAALRRFIERMRGIEHLQFEDYVDKRTLFAWEAKEADERRVQHAAK
jgi:hypothetical protein